MELTRTKHSTNFRVSPLLRPRSPKSIVLASSASLESSLGRKMKVGSRSRSGNRAYRSKLNGQFVVGKCKGLRGGLSLNLSSYLRRDLMSYRALLWTYEKLFDMPISFVSREVTARMRLEVDLANEARNAEKMAAYLVKENSLRDKVLIPKVYWDRTSEAVMTAE